MCQPVFICQVSLGASLPAKRRRTGTDSQRRDNVTAQTQAQHHEHWSRTTSLWASCRAPASRGPRAPSQGPTPGQVPCLEGPQAPSQGPQASDRVRAPSRGPLSVSLSLAPSQPEGPQAPSHWAHWQAQSLRQSPQPTGSCDAPNLPAGFSWRR